MPSVPVESDHIGADVLESAPWGRRQWSWIAGIAVVVLALAAVVGYPRHQPEHKPEQPASRTAAQTVDQGPGSVAALAERLVVAPANASSISLRPDMPADPETGLRWAASRIWTGPTSEGSITLRQYHTADQARARYLSAWASAANDGQTEAVAGLELAFVRIEFADNTGHREVQAESAGGEIVVEVRSFSASADYVRQLLVTQVLALP